MSSSEFCSDSDIPAKPATHLAILYADRGEFDRHRLMRTHLAIFFAERGDVAVLKTRCDKIAQPDELALLAIRSNKRRKSRERAQLANAGEFNRRYLTCQVSAILYADRGDRRVKSLSVSLALDYNGKFIEGL